MAPMLLEIITAERQVYLDEVDVVVAPGIEGHLGILPHHAPLMTVLQPGELMVRKDGVESYLVVTGGFMEVLGNKVTILADAAENSGEIDEQRAQAAVERAQEQVRNRESDVQLEEALHSLRRAQVRVGVARRRRRTGAQERMEQPR
ncbi:MAG: F0F1 ATP synthase subunit epsilon [Chloroflexi bacterium]|nr:F0F1 ATP synthase subunit epsilon [Chloroflexota bacterium]MDA1218066.1 F0F1 ATP synthase subunit epsilon [Chloroflexota bacterium]PKB57933.1 MAG: ATP synthase F1 subunit epsilon [SAR202 cluster bacterium Casp-Chloro-G3]